MAAVVARRTNGRTVRLANYWAGRGRGGHRDDPTAAVALRAALVEDLAARMGH